MGGRLLSIAIAAAVLAAPAGAGFVNLTSRSAFQASGPYVAVDWGVFGAAGTGISTPDFRTVPPLVVEVSSSQGVLSRQDEGGTYLGDFTPGDHLLTDAGSLSDSFIVGFDHPVRGFGMQIEPDAKHGAWSGSIDFFSTGNVLLHSIAIGGTRGMAQDNSAPFYGVISSAADISYAYFWVNQPGFFPSKSGSLAINTMDVLVPAVSEPPGFLLLIGGLLGLLGLGRRHALV